MTADYTAVNRNIAFTGPVSVTISANEDSLNEGNEQFTLILSDTSTGAVRDTATVTIQNVPGPVFGFENPQSLRFDENAGTVEACVFLVSGTISENTPVTVQSGRTGDTATGIHQ